MKYMMQSGLSEGVFVEEIQSEAHKIFEANQSGYKDGSVRFLPSGQVNKYSLPFLVSF